MVFGMQLVQTRRATRNVEMASRADIPEVARLLAQLYKEEAPRMVPSDEGAFTALLEAGLRTQSPATIDSSLVICDSGDQAKLAGHVALSCDHSPRQPPFNWNYLATAFRLLGPRAAQVLWHQFRLTGLMCAALGPKTAQLHSLIVDSAHRGEGIAVGLVRSVEDTARRQGQEAIILYILDGNPVEDFYHRLGYQRVNLPRPQHPLPSSGIAMQRLLTQQYSLNNNDARQDTTACVAEGDTFR
jgi:GNAT superfamily N-acetyltransferase